MSETTPNLGLFKYNSVTDSDLAFNITKALNNNWDILDEAVNSGNSRNIGEIVASTIPLTDAGLHLLDGALIDGSGIYSAFVTYIAGLVNTYPSVFTTEANWQGTVNAYGACGKFVYDSVNNTVRLPKVTGIIEGTTDVNALGDLVQAGLPQHTHTRGSMNITGNMQTILPLAAQSGGALYSPGNTSPYTMDQNNSGYWSDESRLYFNAANSWTGSTSNANYTSTVNTSSTVQPQTIKCYYYIVIATSTKTDIQVDIDDIATDVNGKADRDYSNATYQPVNKAGDSMSGTLSLPRIRCNGNGVNNNFDFSHSSKDGGWYLNADNLSNGVWAEIMSIIDLYSNGTSWYRVYSDGWIEQGGNISESTITFLKPFSNTNYTVTTNNRNNSTSGNTATYNDISIYSNASYNKTTTSIFIRGAGTWYACGY